jgi:hypothetical protein
MEMKLIVDIVVSLMFSCLPAAVFYNAFRRYRLSQSSNKKLYAGMSVFAAGAFLLIALPLITATLPGTVALLIGLSTLPVWALIREFCNLSSDRTFPNHISDRAAQEI